MQNYQELTFYKSNQQKLNSMLSIFIGLLSFLIIFLLYFGFYYPIVNNVEEVPLIYKMLDIAKYQNDSFVSYHTEHFTQIYPFLFLLTSLIKIFNIQNIHNFYFGCFLLTISCYYLILYKIQNSIVKVSPITFAFLLNAIFIIFYKLPLVPADRWVINNFFDPELLLYVIVFCFISLHLSSHLKLAAVFLFLATLLYPVYVIPLMPAILISLYQIFKERRREFYKTLFLYFTPSSIYILFLWSLSRQTENLHLDASLVIEVVRAPWHYQIPTLLDLFNNSSNYFFLIIILNILIFIALLNFKQKKLRLIPYNLDYFKKIFSINILLILTLVVTSLISSFMRIPLLIQVSPYRIGVFIILMTALILVGVSTIIFRNAFKGRYQITISRHYQLVLSLILVLIFALVGQNTLRNSSPRDIAVNEELFIPNEEIFNWIETNTKSDAFFLNYTLLSVRTYSKRSEYFSFKNIPLVANQQIDWFYRFLTLQGIPKEQALIYLQKTKENSKGLAPFMFVGDVYKNLIQVDKFDTLRNIPNHVDYIIVSRRDLSLEGKLDLAYSNQFYQIYSTEKYYNRVYSN